MVLVKVVAVARYDGEEFVVVLPDVDAAGAVRAFEDRKSTRLNSSHQ